MLATLVTISMMVSLAAGKADPVNKNSDGAALKGYDAVAYFTEGKPVKGSPQFQYDWMGAKWLFASAANRDQFAKDPAKYAPQFGGYCAYAVSQGHTANIDPEAWRVVEGRLYLNWSKGVQKKWEADVPGNIKKGNENWPNLHR
jgi:YHS domain-containing protein